VVGEVLLEQLELEDLVGGLDADVRLEPATDSDHDVI
jgi:hypothetical protein